MLITSDHTICLHCGADYAVEGLSAHLDSCATYQALLVPWDEVVRRFESGQGIDDLSPVGKLYRQLSAVKVKRILEHRKRQLSKTYDKHGPMLRRVNLRHVVKAQGGVAAPVAAANGAWLVFNAYRAVVPENLPLTADIDKLENHEIKFWVGGTKMQSRPIRQPNEDRDRVGSARGKVSEFTPAARWRLLLRIGEFLKSALAAAQFVTLTYPSEYPSAQEAKQDLRAFIKRLRRRYPGACVVWRMEYQKRGAVHFHLLVFGVKFLAFWWVARSWYQVVGSGDEKHLKAGTEVRRVRSAAGAMSYVGKYLAKQEGGVLEEDCGRFWGVEGPEILYQAAVVSLHLSGAELLKLGRYLRSWVRSQRRRAAAHARSEGRRGFSVRRSHQEHVIGRSKSYLINAEYWFDRLSSILAQEGI